MDWPGWRAMFAKDDGVETFEPLPRDFVDGIEASLGIVLPPALRTLYRATDGVFDKLGQWFVNWPLERMAEEHHHAWTDAPMARRQLLGFGNDGTGAPFCVPSDGSDGVFVWNHIDQQAYRLAGTVEEFLGRLAYRSDQHLTRRRELGADPRSRRTLMPRSARYRP